MSLTPRVDNIEKNAVRNVIINGNFDLWQRGTVFAAVANEQYTADRFVYRKVGSMVHTAQQSSDLPADVVGAQYSLELLQTTPDDSLAGSDFCAIEQRIEGYNMVGIPGNSVNVSFWVKAGITGDYILRIQRFGGPVIEDALYTINAADTWEKKSITIAIPDDGSYNLDNQAALRVGFFLALTGSAMVNGVATGATSFKLAQVMFTVVPEDFDETIDVPFQRAGRTFGEELAMAQRYYEKSYDLETAPGTGIGNGAVAVNTGPSNAQVFTGFRFKVHKRATPTVNMYQPLDGSLNFLRQVSNGAGHQINSIEAAESGVRRGGFTVGAADQTHEGHFTADAEL